MLVWRGICGNWRHRIDENGTLWRQILFRNHGFKDRSEDGFQFQDGTVEAEMPYAAVYFLFLSAERPCAPKEPVAVVVGGFGWLHRQLRNHHR